MLLTKDNYNLHSLIKSTLFILQNFINHHHLKKLKSNSLKYPNYINILRIYSYFINYYTRTNITEANYACTLKTNNNTIELNTPDKQTMVDSLIVTSSCQDEDNNQTLLTIDASGASRGVSLDPQILGVAYSDGKLQIHG